MPVMVDRQTLTKKPRPMPNEEMLAQWFENKPQRHIVCSGGMYYVLLSAIAPRAVSGGSLMHGFGSLSYG